MSNPLLRILGRASYRAVYSILGGIALALWGMSRGWPWWVAVPAGILVAATVFVALVSALYAYTKLSYPARAEAIRARTNPCRTGGAAAEPRANEVKKSKEPCARDRAD